MIDELEALMEAVEEEIDLGMSLVFNEVILPRVEGVEAEKIQTDAPGTSARWGELFDAVGEWNSRNQVGNWPVEYGVGGMPRQMNGVDKKETSSLADEAARLERIAQTALGMDVQRGVGGQRMERSSGEVVPNIFSVAATMGRQSVATVETARVVDRAMERDARRYDGGFLLG